MRRRPGFTLIELLVALAVGGLVLVAAHRVFVGVVDGVARVEAARATLDREANVRRRLATLVGSIEVDGAGNGFAGESHGIAFTTWDTDRIGRAVHRRIVVSLVNGALMLGGAYPEPVPLLEGVDSLALDYLLDLGAGQRFVRKWYSDAGAPTALRMRITRGAVTDTLLLIVGPRG